MSPDLLSGWIDADSWLSPGSWLAGTVVVETAQVKVRVVVTVGKPHCLGLDRLNLLLKHWDFLTSGLDPEGEGMVLIGVGILHLQQK